jgi:predicted nucleotidyltransferase
MVTSAPRRLEMATVHIDLPQDKIVKFCARWKVTELALFGSVLRDDFRPDSDVDVLVRFGPDASWGLFEFMQMEEELAKTLGRPVDLVARAAVEESRNWIRRKQILDESHIVFAA